MKLIFGIPLLVCAFSAGAAEWPCTVHATKNTPDSALAGMAKVTQADAQKAALAGFSNFASPATIAESELEIERDCLVYSFDVQVAGQKGVEEVLVDAGSGKVLSRKHETSKHEAAEARHEAAEAKKAAAKPAGQATAEGAGT